MYKYLWPLFQLAAAEVVTGIARGIAFQLVEGLGVLERQKVAEEVKGLDQPSRAMLRKHGVRFGAYHIYVPALLKPAPRALAVQLWALKHGGPEHGLENLQHLAASGRTSIPVDEKMPRLLYQTSGYRVCGARAIRVDILERLADLIRPALAWRKDSNGAKPPGAFDGRTFMVTGAMTSLTGASGEDFASVLRALGYRMEKRPKPGETPAMPDPSSASSSAEKPPEPAALEAATSTATEAPAAEPIESVDPLPEAETTTNPIPVPEYFPTETTTTTQVPVEAAPAPETVVEAAAPVTAAAAEPDMIEVWRPGRPDGPRRKREDKKPRRRERREVRSDAKPAEAQPAGEAQAAAPAPAETPRDERKPRHGGDGKRDQSRDRDRVGERERNERHGRPRRSEKDERRDNKDRGEQRERFGRRRDRRDRDDDNRAPRTWSSDERRGKEADPNSPFAKLLALKEQLESNSK